MALRLLVETGRRILRLRDRREVGLSGTVKVIRKDLQAVEPVPHRAGTKKNTQPKVLALAGYTLIELSKDGAQDTSPSYKRTCSALRACCGPLNPDLNLASNAVSRD